MFHDKRGVYKGLLNFGRSWTPLKHRKIRVNAVSPGLIDTPMTRTPEQELFEHHTLGEDGNS
jgi:NAD(P)-dependent dehydrogenase (short-subunit alcohol dehydrogenase family)